MTPRVGKAVEVNALWLNALRIAGARSKRWQSLYRRRRLSLATRFWNPERGCLSEVIDVDHQAEAVDPSVRPNQIFAVGASLPRDPRTGGPPHC